MIYLTRSEEGSSRAMAVPACDSVFDVVFWLIDRALNDKEYLAPQKMHHLLYLSQAYHAVLNRGARLVPAVFIAHEMGPMEPNVYRIFQSSERPYIERLMVPEGVEDFLDTIWRRFGHYSADYLNRALKLHPPYAEALRQAPRTEITLAAMIKFYSRTRNDSETRATTAPNAERMVKPKVLTTQTGRAVTVKQWIPGSAK
ncbi:MAG: type II toxin-antitoxin system antitoxin SocA domain-containing protein [Alphaproteobacteria bacterium]